ncbi:MAG: hypothetical protein IPH13_21150 [Planctomycetes bacterium]|nr:hypothetical protein [Planctomycetota bacterium]MCC7170147.1 hypothetical protein [Planctomycetota bacterium]
MIAATTTRPGMRGGVFASCVVAALFAQDPVPRRGDPSSVRPAARSAEAIVADLDATPLPGFFTGDDAEVVRRALLRRAELARELFEAEPNHPRVPDAYELRLGVLLNTEGDVAGVVRETEALMETSSMPADVRELARVWRTCAAMKDPTETPASRLAHIDRMLVEFEHGARARLYAENLLVDFAWRETIDVAEQKRACARAIELGRDHGDLTAERELVRVLGLIGKPLELGEFTNVADGARVDFADIRTRRIVLFLMAAYPPFERPEDDDFATLRALRDRVGPDAVSVVGLIDMPPTRDFSKVPWPVRREPIDDPMRIEETLVWELGFRRNGVYVVLDADHVVLAVTTALERLEPVFAP